MLSRRAALKGGTATVAAIAAGGPVAARVAVDDSAIEAAARIHWARNAEHWGVLRDPNHTDEQSSAYLDWNLEAYDALMEIPASDLKGLGIEARAYRHEWFEAVHDYVDDSDLDGLPSDIERLAGRAEP